MKWSRPFDPATQVIWVGARVHGTQGDTRDLHLVLDTGSAITIIDEELASSIGLDRKKKIGEDHLVGSDNRDHPIYYVETAGFEAFGRRLSSLVIGCGPLPVNAGVEGLLGLDFFRDLDLHVSFRHGIIILTDE